MNVRHIREEDADPYVLGVLDQQEARAVEAHCKICPPCCKVVDEARRLVHRLGLAAGPVLPPPEVKLRLMARLEPARIERPTLLAQPRRLRVLVAAMAMVMLFMGVVNLRLQSQSATMRDERNAVMAQLDQEWQFLARHNFSSHALSPAQPGSAARGMVHLWPDDGMLLLVVEGLPPLPEGQGYRFWLAGDGAPIPQTWLNLSASGRAGTLIKLQGDLSAYRHMMLTVGPRDQQSEPGTPLLAGEL